MGSCVCSMQGVCLENRRSHVNCWLLPSSPQDGFQLHDSAPYRLMKLSVSRNTQVSLFIYSQPGAQFSPTINCFIVATRIKRWIHYVNNNTFTQSNSRINIFATSLWWVISSFGKRNVCCERCSVFWPVSSVYCPVYTEDHPVMSHEYTPQSTGRPFNEWWCMQG